MAHITHLLWVDLEGTGPEPSLDEIIEVGAILTDMELNELDSYAAIVKPSQRALERLYAVPEVVEMHTRSGLLDDIEGRSAARTERLEATEQAILDMLDRHEVEKFTLAGSGVAHYDRPMIDEHMPRLAKRLSKNRIYWSFDTGNLRRAWDFFAPTPLRPGYSVSNDKTHRAHEDIRDHLEETRIAASILRGLN